MIRMQRPVAIVVTDSVRGAEIGYPTCLEEWNQPGAVLRRDSYRAGDRQSNRTAKPDGAIQDAIDATQGCAPESGQAVLEYLVQIAAFVNAAYPHRPALIAGTRLGWKGGRLWHFPRISQYNPSLTPRLDGLRQGHGSLPRRVRKVWNFPAEKQWAAAEAAAHWLKKLFCVRSPTAR